MLKSLNIWIVTSHNVISCSDDVVYGSRNLVPGSRNVVPVLVTSFPVLETSFPDLVTSHPFPSLFLLRMSGGPSGARQTGSREVMIPYESSKQNLGLFNDEALDSVLDFSEEMTKKNYFLYLGKLYF